MTQEEKTRAYDGLLDKAKQIYNKENDVLIKHIIEGLFPELKESEDERIRKTLIDYMASVIDINGIKGETIIAWLKSLKPQNRWNPSDEQMKALADALSLAKNCGEDSSFDLRTLYEQLKKLKENKL
jgi:hypothetical protein